MARIKAVMNERRIAYEGAVKLIAEHQETVQDMQLLRLQQSAFIKAQEKLTAFQTKGRKLARERRKQLLKTKEELGAEGVLPAAAATAEAEAAQVTETTPSEPEAAPEPAKAESVDAAPSATPAQEASAIPTGTSPQSAADTAAAGLFGGPVESPAQKK